MIFTSYERELQILECVHTVCPTYNRKLGLTCSTSLKNLQYVINYEIRKLTYVLDWVCLHVLHYIYALFMSVS